MPRKNIYISDELNSKLEKEENTSALIQKLLNDFYKSNECPEDKLKKINKEIEFKLEEAKILKENIDKMIEDQQLIVDSEMAKEELENEKNIRWDIIEKLQREVFKNYEIQKDEMETLFNEFFDLLKAKKIDNVVSFMKIKNINKKTAFHKRVLIN